MVMVPTSSLEIVTVLPPPLPFTPLIFPHFGIILVISAAWPGGMRGAIKYGARPCVVPAVLNNLAYFLHICLFCIIRHNVGLFSPQSGIPAPALRVNMHANG